MSKNRGWATKTVTDSFVNFMLRNKDFEKTIRKYARYTQPEDDGYLSKGIHEVISEHLYGVINAYRFDERKR